MTLHMLRLSVNAQAVIDHGRQAGLCDESVIDWGYLLHVYLTDLFGTKAPRPFHLDTRALADNRVCVLGYVTEDPEVLRNDAQHFANPLVWSSTEWNSKPMPERFQKDQRFGFSVRVCPVKCMRSKDKKIERDVFDPRDNTSRSVTYHLWLRRRLKGAFVIESDLQGFRVNPLLRRTQAKNVAQREKKIILRPDAIIQGLLQVTNPEEFQATLMQGVGDHRGFGFGMLLLRRPA